MPAASNPRPDPAAAPAPLRGPGLLLATALGTGLLLLAGHWLLNSAGRPSPNSSATSLELQQRWHPDPGRRREAALLLHGQAADQPARQRQLLKGQGWGQAPLAAVVLKQDALAAAALGQNSAADQLWRQLQHRFPASPAAADALYALGRRQPARRQELLQRFPSHPAALAAALELGPDPAGQRQGALHLARWGARWPGAEERIRQACRASASAPGSERQSLAAALAQLGDGDEALRCLGDQRGTAASELAVARALLPQPQSRDAAAERLLALVRQHPSSPEAGEAVRLLSEAEDEAALQRLKQLPPSWQASAPVQARRALASGEGWQEVLQRWPQDPASRELQWQLARRRLLAGEWRAAQQLLDALKEQSQPPPLAARQLFWRGWLMQRQGQQAAATDQWRRLLALFPGGYYGWRAAIQLGQASPRLTGLTGDAADQGSAAAPPWLPLGSGLPLVDELWRLQQPLEAWETWRHQRRQQPPQTSQELAVEGRLRLAIGDDWTGLGQLEQAGLRQEGASCSEWLELEQALHPARYAPLLSSQARAQGVPPALLQGLAKQESRFSPGVSSGAGAIGLLQLMPATAAELAGRALEPASLKEPEANAELGARYLSQLLKQWGGELLPAVASYNAGPGAVASWINPQLQVAPELWVEAIPYPETRLYVKKVLGNAWSYQQLPSWRC
ncbi:MAG: transglycosylase SLT domain-containing protein [Prochlorococcaceae cyanobacterium]